MAQGEEGKKRMGFGWDPTRPSAVWVVASAASATLPGVAAAAADEEAATAAASKIALNEQFSDSGTGCNEHELTALLNLVSEHDKFQKQDAAEEATAGVGYGRVDAASDATSYPYRSASSKAAQPKSMSDVKSLFRTYRAAVSECIAQWGEELEKRDEQGEGAAEPETLDPLSLENLELLNVNYAVLHLSNVFLPLLPSEQREQSMDLLHSYSSMQDPYSVPGLATADMVRYLRYNHTMDVEQEDELVSEMLQAAQPEHYTTSSGENLYWQVVTKLVLRGCLEKAWTVLSKHSLFVAASQFRTTGNNPTTDLNPDYAATLDQVEMGFLHLRELLLRAPLPAGRNAERDNDLDWDDEDTADIEEAAIYFFDDLPVLGSDYKFWEPSNASAGGGDDVPVDFQAGTAKRKHQQWQNYILDRVGTLVRQIPELDGLVAILAGNLSQASFSTWAERLLAELLYQEPDIKPCHISRRATRILRQYEDAANVQIVNSFIHVMEGNAGEAIEVLFDYGAGSGAALPATLLALLFSLFVDATILPSSENERKIEFLCQAAWSIQSSLGGTMGRQSDMGVQLAVRLLMPYANDNKRIRATVAQILEHYAPTTDHFARTLISQCRPLIERNSLQILEACTNVLLNWYPRQMKEYNMEAAVSTILYGMELEALVLPNASLGTCYRALTQLCLGTADTLLKLVLGEEQGGTDSERSHVVAQAMANVFAGHQNTVSVEEIPEAMLVVRTLHLFDAMVLHEHEKAVEKISQALAGDADAGNGNMILRNLHWNLLRIAKNLLEVHEETSKGISFDTDAMRLLMETLTRLMALPSRPYPVEQVEELQVAFANGFALAFGVENAEKKELRGSSVRGHPNDLTGIQTSNLGAHSLHTQERFVQGLLNGF